MAIQIDVGEASDAIGLGIVRRLGSVCFDNWPILTFAHSKSSLGIVPGSSKGCSTDCGAWKHQTQTASQRVEVQNIGDERLEVRPFHEWVLGRED